MPEPAGCEPAGPEPAATEPAGPEPAATAPDRAHHLRAEISQLETTRELLRVATGADTAPQIVARVEDLRTHLAIRITESRRRLNLRSRRLDPRDPPDLPGQRELPVQPDQRELPGSDRVG